MTSLNVNIDVDDLERGVAFYTAALELKVGRRFGTAVVELLGAEATIYLLKAEAGTAPFEGASSSRDYHRHWTPVHLDFVVDDLEATLRRAEAAGAKRESEIIVEKWGRMVRLSDIFGHGVCLLEFSARGYDEIATV